MASTGESDVEFLARMEAEDAAAFASAVAEWRTEREAGGGAARIVERGGGFAADGEAAGGDGLAGEVAGDDGLEGVDAEWLAGDEEGAERRSQLIRNGGKRSSAEAEAAEAEAADLPERFAAAASVSTGQGDEGGEDAPSGRPPSDVWAAARRGDAAGLAPFLPAQRDAIDPTGLSPLYNTMQGSNLVGVRVRVRVRVFDPTGLSPLYNTMQGSNHHRLTEESWQVCCSRVRAAPWTGTTRSTPNEQRRCACCSPLPLALAL